MSRAARAAADAPVVLPFPWTSLLSYMAPRSTPSIETLDGAQYARVTDPGRVLVSYDAAAASLRCSFHGVDAADGLGRVRRLFDTAHDPGEIRRVLARCPMLRARLRKLPGMRVPGCWEPFELCVRVILGQQVSVAAAHTLMKRLAARCPAFTPEQVAGADLDGMGLTGGRQRTVRTLAERVASGDIRFATQSWEEIAGRLREVPGFGPWTLAYLALRLGRDGDAFPETDLGLLRAAGVERPKDLARMAEAWRPFRGYAAMYLWAVEIQTREC